MLILQSVCSDYAMAIILMVIKRILSLIQLVVPILLIFSGIMHTVKMVANPDEKKNMKKLINSFAAAVIVFFIPFTINLSMTVINESGDVKGFNVFSCWNNASSVDIMDSANDSTKKTIKQEENSVKKK